MVHPQSVMQQAVQQRAEQMKPARLSRRDYAIAVAVAFALTIVGSIGMWAQAARLAVLGQPLGLALEQAGIHRFGLRGAEQQLKHLGRQRATQLYDWLLEIDQGFKGGSQLSQRTLLERLVIRLARKEPQ